MTAGTGTGKQELGLKELVHTWCVGGDLATRSVLLCFHETLRGIRDLANGWPGGHWTRRRDGRAGRGCQVDAAMARGQISFCLVSID